MIFQGIRTSIAKEPYIFVIFQGGPNPLPPPPPPPPSGSAHDDAALGFCQFILILLSLLSYCMRVLVNLETCQTRIKLIFAYLKHSLLMGVRRCLDCWGLSLHPLKNFELVSSVTLTRLHKSADYPEPSLITSSCSDPVIKKRYKGIA